MKLWTLILGSLLVVPGTGPAGNKDKKEKRAPVGRLFSPIGTLLVQEQGKKTWSLPELYAGLSSEDRLLVLPGAKGVVQVREGDVHLILSGRLPGLAQSPVLEAAARLHVNKEFDLDMTLDGGRALIENHKKDEPAKLRFRIQEDKLDVTLVNKGAAVAIQAFSEWPAFTPFLKKSKKGREPEIRFTIYLLKGKVELHLKTEKHSLEAPKQGVTLFHLSSFDGFHGPIYDKYPELWIKPRAEPSAQTAAWHKAVESLRRGLADKKSVDRALTTALEQKDALKRAVAVGSAGGVGDLGIVLAAFHDKSAEVRRGAALTLLHESNRSQAANLALYKFLIERKFPPGQAEIAMELLHGFCFSPQARKRPETYETLISYLQNKNIAIRELSAWRLYALVPQGKDIAYDAAGSADERARAQADWRKLIPEGKLPPRP
jgi:hypothetical protein